MGDTLHKMQVIIEATTSWEFPKRVRNLTTIR